MNIIAPRSPSPSMVPALVAAIAALALVPVAPGRADERAPGRVGPEIEKLEGRARELDAAGKKDEAERVRREIGELRERAGHVEAEAREARARRDDQGRERHGEREDVERRLHHVEVAVENLRAAGLEEIAAHVAREADRMRAEPRGGEGRRGDPGRERGGGREIAGQIERLSAQVRELQGAVRELRARVEARAEPR